jgi:hypothetical protein
MSGAIHPLPQYAFMAWCLDKKNTGTILPFTFTHINLLTVLMQLIKSSDNAVLTDINSFYYSLFIIHYTPIFCMKFEALTEIYILHHCILLIYILVQYAVPEGTDEFKSRSSVLWYDTDVSEDLTATFASYHNTMRHHNPEEPHMNLHRRENIKFRT